MKNIMTGAPIVHLKHLVRIVNSGIVINDKGFTNKREKDVFFTSYADFVKKILPGLWMIFRDQEFSAILYNGDRIVCADGVSYPRPYGCVVVIIDVDTLGKSISKMPVENVGNICPFRGKDPLSQALIHAMLGTRLSVPYRYRQV